MMRCAREIANRPGRRWLRSPRWPFSQPRFSADAGEIDLLLTGSFADLGDEQRWLDAAAFAAHFGKEEAVSHAD